MVSPFLILLYVILAALVGYVGRKRTVGFAGAFILSLLLSSLIMALVLMVSGSRSDA